MNATPYIAHVLGEFLINIIAPNLQNGKRSFVFANNETVYDAETLNYNVAQLFAELGTGKELKIGGLTLFDARFFMTENTISLNFELFDAVRATYTFKPEEADDKLCVMVGQGKGDETLSYIKIKFANCGKLKSFKRSSKATNSHVVVAMEMLGAIVTFFYNKDAYRRFVDQLKEDGAESPLFDRRSSLNKTSRSLVEMF